MYLSRYMQYSKYSYLNEINHNPMPNLALTNTNFLGVKT